MKTETQTYSIYLFCRFSLQSLLQLLLSQKQNQSLIPMLIPTCCMVDTMDWDTEDTDTVSTTATTTARGRLRLPLRLRLTPTFCMVDMVLDMVILAMATVLATGDTTGDKLPTPLQDLNHRRKTLTLFV